MVKYVGMAGIIALTGSLATTVIPMMSAYMVPAFYGGAFAGATFGLDLIDQTGQQRAEQENLPRSSVYKASPTSSYPAPGTIEKNSYSETLKV